MTDTKALREKISERGLKLKFVAEKVGLSYQGLQNKIENKSDFTTTEISTLCELLNITSLKEKESIFFATKVD